jgi:hypothetical protein
MKSAACSNRSQPLIPTEASQGFRRSQPGSGASHRRGEWGQFAVASSSLLFFAARSLRNDSPLSSRRWALGTSRSSMAADVRVPVVDRELAGDDGRHAAVAIPGSARAERA